MIAGIVHCKSKSEETTKVNSIFTQDIQQECGNQIPVSSLDNELNDNFSDLTVVNGPMDLNVCSETYNTPNVQSEVVTVNQSSLRERPLNISDNITLNTLSFNSNNSTPFVLVPLSMLQLPQSSNLKIIQKSYSENKPNFLQSSSFDTSLNNPTNASEKDSRRNFLSRQNILVNKSRHNVSTDKNSKTRSVKEKEVRRNIAKEEKRIGNKNVGRLKRQILRKRAETGLKTKSNLKKNFSDGGSLLCLVCGEKAGRHTYYGGRSCQSCRAFFRRSVETMTK